jgi:lipoprotein-anchoring transpeptidase ErfK/SrfK
MFPLPARTVLRTSFLSLLIISACGLAMWKLIPHSSTISSLPAAVLEAGTATTTPPVLVPIEPKLLPYIEIVDSCDWEYIGTCINMRSGPGMKYPVVLRLRNGMVLKVAGTVTVEGEEWYKIQQDKSVRYPDRIASNWYVLADTVNLISDDGDHRLVKGEVVTTEKRIVVNLSEEMLYAYDGDVLFMQEPISTGLYITPTPLGTFTVYAMTPSRYMQGPLPGVSDQVYDLPGVPWNLYFTTDGAVIHGAYWHNKFGQPWSHGCVNLPPDKAKELYLWSDIGMKVTVEN